MARLLEESRMTLGGSTVALARAPASHVATVEDGAGRTIPEGTPVAPNVAIRLVADGLRPFSVAHFFLAPEGGGPLLLNEDDVRVGWSGQAWLDIRSPNADGRYVFIANGVSGLIGSEHGAFTILTVDHTAPVPPPEPSPGIALGLQRLSGSTWVTASGIVGVNESLRAIASGLPALNAVRFKLVEFGTSMPFLVDRVERATIGGNASTIFTSPNRAGRWRLLLEVDARDQAFLDFDTSLSAPPPSEEPPPPGGLGGFLGNIKGLLIVGGVVAGLMIFGPSIAGLIHERQQR